MELQQSSTGGEQTARPGGGWVFPMLLVAVLVAMAWAQQMGPNDIRRAADSSKVSTGTPTPKPEGQTVGLTIDFGNGATRQFEGLPWREGMTVEGLMQAAAQTRPGIEFTQQGEHETGFLQSIDRLENQGTGDRNWQYEVNGRHAIVSFCVQKLEPADRVLWKFVGQE